MAFDDLSDPDDYALLENDLQSEATHCTTEGPRVRTEQGTKESDPRPPNSRLALPNRTPFSPNGQPAKEGETDKVKEIGGNENGSWPDCVCKDFYKLTYALSATEAEAIYDVLVREEHHWETFFTLCNNMTDFKCFYIDREPSQLTALRL